MHVKSSLHLVRFGQLLYAGMQLQYNDSVNIEMTNMQVELIRFRKHIYFIDVGNFEVASDVFRHGKSFQHHFTLIVFFVFVFKYLRSLQHVSRVCRIDCVQIVDILYVLL